MPFPMVHLCIAGEILKINSRLNNYSDFYMGSLVPDAVHFRPEFSGNDKKASHLCVSDEAWGKIFNNEEWAENVLDFFRKQKDNYSYEFIFGYASHILADITGNIELWMPFAAKYPYELNNPWGSLIHKEQYEIDTRIYFEQKDEKAIWESLKKSKGVDLPGIVSAGEMDKMIPSILYEQYSSRFPDSDFKFEFISLERMKEFINTNAVKINKRLSEI